MLPFKIGDKTFESLVLGTGKFGSNQQMEEAILASGERVSYCRTKTYRFRNRNRCYFSTSKTPKLIYCPILRVQEMRSHFFAAQLARRSIETNWLKLKFILIQIFTA
jgi:thiazole synthase